MVVGCTGRGKTTFCNFLFQEPRFQTEKDGWGAAMSDVNRTEMSQLVDRIGGVTLTVIDTPGFLATERRCCNTEGVDDSGADKDALLQEFSRALVYARDGIDAILVTLKCAEPASKEEQLLMEFLTEMQVWKHCILLFTHGSRVSKGKDEGYMELHGMLKSGKLAERSPVLQKMVENCGKRFLIVESVKKADDKSYHRSKLDELYSAVESARNNAKCAFNHHLLDVASKCFKMVQEQKMSQTQLEAAARDRDIVKERHEKLEDALKERPQKANTSENIQQDVEDAATLLLQYLRAPKEEKDASPRHFVAALSQLEEGKMKGQETAARLGDLLEDIKGGKKRRIPRAEVEKQLESIMISNQEEEQEAEAPGGDQAAGEESKWYEKCTYL